VVGNRSRIGTLLAARSTSSRAWTCSWPRRLCEPSCDPTRPRTGSTRWTEANRSVAMPATGMGRSPGRPRWSRRSPGSGGETLGSSGERPVPLTRLRFEPKPCNSKEPHNPDGALADFGCTHKVTVIESPRGNRLRPRPEEIVLVPTSCRSGLLIPGSSFDPGGGHRDSVVTEDRDQCWACTEPRRAPSVRARRGDAIAGY
jgi:hypothetical protein